MLTYIIIFYFVGMVLWLLIAPKIWYLKYDSWNIDNTPYNAAKLAVQVSPIWFTILVILLALYLMTAFSKIKIDSYVDSITTFFLGKTLDKDV